VVEPARKEIDMSVGKRLFVAVLATAAGLTAWGLFAWITDPTATYGNVAAVTVVFASAYIATVHGARRRLLR
jgi:hypothetical protein